MKISEIIAEIISHNKALWLGKKMRIKADEASAKLGADSVRDLVVNDSRPIFCLSTGRTGTKFLTEAFKQSPELMVEHEPFPEFLFHNKYAFENANMEATQFVFDGARYEYLRLAFLTKKTFFETNTRVSFFAPAIKNLIPNSRFIYLYRDCYSFVESGINRNWYNSHVYDEGRITFQNASRWEKWTQIQKVAWLWCETNNFIERFLQELSPAEFISIDSTLMYKNKETQSEIEKFVGASNVIWPGKKVNSSKHKTTKLNESQKAEVSGIMDEFYKGIIK